MHHSHVFDEASRLYCLCLFPTSEIIIWIEYFNLQKPHSYLDRINVSNARLAGMQEDCGMDDTTWSAGISTFYVGYMVGQLPGNGGDSNH